MLPHHGSLNEAETKSGGCKRGNHRLQPPFSQFLAPFSPPSRHRCGHTLCRTTQTSRFPAQNPLPGEKWQFYSEKLGVKLKKQERSNLLFFPGANNTLTMTSGAHRKFPRRNDWQCAPDALCFRNTHSNRFSDLTGDSWAAGTDLPLAPPASSPGSWLSIKSSPSKLTSVESPASESVSSAGGL